MTNQQNKESLFNNRELSWLEFNDRVLNIGRRQDRPLLERLKFMAIVSSNLDEFFMIRVAGLMQQVSAGRRKRDMSGLTPARQLARISERAHVQVADQIHTTGIIFDRLKETGIHLLRRHEWTMEHKQFARNFFQFEILPTLTPMALERLREVPLLPSRVLFVALLIENSTSNRPDDEPARDIIVIPVPNLFSRFITLPSEEQLYLTPIEEIIADNTAILYPGRNILSTAYFRVTRDADVTIQEDEAGDLLNTIEAAMIERRRRKAVRLEISADCDPSLRKYLMDLFELNEDFTFDITGLLDKTALMEIANRPGYPELKVPDWPPQPPRDLLDSEDLFKTIQEKDIMLFLPYESFDPVVQMVRQAADDPGVMAIKQTLYRTSGDSPIISALEKAAENGKQVTVLVELKARFDEERNVHWARRLEDAGCHVIYGIANLKTHCKALLIVRREGARICRYVHLATGNYNDKTAKLYSDIGMMTADKNLALDVSSLFNLMTGASDSVGMTKLTIAPLGLRKKIRMMIRREIQASTPDRPGLIMAKMNSLEDEAIIEELYKAAQAGVKIILSVRGICCLRPGVKNVSENIEVYSIVDRFLEHARIFYFANGGHEEVYMASADWMGRNFDRRIETMFPVTDARLKKRLIHILEVNFSDNTFNMRLNPDGSYTPVQTGRTPVRAQELFYQEATNAVSESPASQRRFRPLKQPDE